MRPVLNFIRERWIDTLRFGLEDEGNKLGLPVPYTVPCAKAGFQHLYYWDIYFACRGLNIQGLKRVTRWNCDALIHLLDRYGFVPNASCTYLVKCSQPPFLADTIALVLSQQEPGVEDWQRKAALALEREHAFWMGNRLLDCGLNCYGHHVGDVIGEDAVPARLDQEFEWLCVGRMGMAPVSDPVARRSLADHTLAEAESGWDFTPRFERRCKDFAAVDLNTLLFRSEQLLSELWDRLGEPERAAGWSRLAARRGHLVQELCWEESRGCFADWDSLHKRCGQIDSAAMFFPLWGGLATREQAVRTLEHAEREIILPHGVVTCAKNDSGLSYQWDYPNAWPPLQLIAWEACARYGADDLARKIAAAFVDTVDRNFQTTGDLWEKYNAVDGSIDVCDEYPMPAMMGWTSGTYVAARQFLDDPGSVVFRPGLDSLVA